MVDENKWPDFVGIGAPRSGTTWLGKNLSKHPDIWIPRRKELHYFTRAQSYPSPSSLSEDSFVRRIIGVGGRAKGREFRKSFAKSIAYDMLKLSWSGLAWDLRYFCKPAGDEWYSSLFAAHSDKTTGEITPAYLMMTLPDIREFVALMPRVKVIFIMRNPVDQVWSTLRYNEQRWGSQVQSYSGEAIRRYLRNDGIARRSDYLSVLDNWLAVIPPDRFFVAWYDEILADPEDLLRRLLRFLAVDENATSGQPELGRRINASTSKDMPPEVRSTLESHFRQSVETLAQRFPGSYAERWYQEMLARA